MAAAAGEVQHAHILRQCLADTLAEGGMLVADRSHAFEVEAVFDLADGLIPHAAGEGAHLCHYLFNGTYIRRAHPALAVNATGIHFTGGAEFGGEHNLLLFDDDRLGCAIMIELLQGESKFDYTCVFTVQEEVGTRGATVSAYTVNPDYAIVLETTTASDIPDTPENKKVCKVGNGAVVSFMDRGTIYNKDLYKRAREIADKNGIANQTKTVVAGGNDAAAIHKAAGGIKTVAVSLPCRYIHSASSVGSKKDMECVKDLAKALLEEFANG